MSWRRLRPALLHRRSPTTRRIIGCLMLAAYVVIASGVPLPSVRIRDAGGEPYPCMAGICGCRTATDCWRSCCCHTLAERLAWARKHGVTPPEWVLTLQESPASSIKLSDRVACDAFSRRSSASNCCTKVVPADDASSQAHESLEVHPVIAMHNFQCRGTVADQTTAAPVLLPNFFQLSCSLPLVAWLGPERSTPASGIAIAPTSPPPESASSDS